MKEKLFKIFVIINPCIALIGMTLLAFAINKGWIVLQLYNLINIFVYYQRKKEFGMYCILSCIYFCIGIVAEFNF